MCTIVTIFSTLLFTENSAVVISVYTNTPNIEIHINSIIKLQIIHDSIWNHYQELETIIISFSDQGQRDFFDRIPKVMNLKKINMDEIFEFCTKNKINRLGFTPFGRGNYYSFLKKIKDLKNEYPKEISLYHLNKHDYREIKEYAGNKG